MAQAWFALAAAGLLSGCMTFEKDYRVESVQADAWLPGDFLYFEVRDAFEALGFDVDESKEPELTASNTSMTLRGMRSEGIDGRRHPDTWTLQATYDWLDRHGDRDWHDLRAGADEEGRPFWNEARWHFDGLLRDVAAEGDGKWEGTADRRVELRIEERTNHLEPRT